MREGENPPYRLFNLQPQRNHNHPPDPTHIAKIPDTHQKDHKAVTETWDHQDGSKRPGGDGLISHFTRMETEAQEGAVVFPKQERMMLRPKATLLTLPFHLLLAPAVQDPEAGLCAPFTAGRRQ